jgi:2-succinyl-5-enolpyruvyl-6-hydroxy-3-cyclohexene-1-carboxylate synthase
MSDVIMITVKAEGKEDVRFKMPYHFKFEKLASAYANKILSFAKLGSVKFMYNGADVRIESTIIECFGGADDYGNVEITAVLPPPL